MVRDKLKKSIYIYKVVISVCLFAFTIITHKPQVGGMRREGIGGRDEKGGFRWEG